jgi:hypothetical protein
MTKHIVIDTIFGLIVAAFGAWLALHPRPNKPPPAPASSSSTGAATPKPSDDGKGDLSNAEVPPSRVEPDGAVALLKPIPPGYIETDEICVACRGSGKTAYGPCYSCQGTGHVLRPKPYTPPAQPPYQQPAALSGRTAPLAPNGLPYPYRWSPPGPMPTTRFRNYTWMADAKGSDEQGWWLMPNGQPAVMYQTGTCATCGRR